MTVATPRPAVPHSAAFVTRAAIVDEPAQPTAPGAPERGQRTSWWTLAAIGVVGGMLSGLFAIGGGILMVPLLVWRARMDQRRAAATSLVAIIPAALVSSGTYLVHGKVDLMASVFVAAGAVVGAALGSRLLRRLPLSWLRWMFVGFILLVALRLLLLDPGHSHGVALTPTVAFGYLGVGLVMGLASGLFGIGGGIIAVPLLMSLFSVAELVAKGIALSVSVPTSVVGTVSNRRSGLVDVRAGLLVGAAAALASFPAVYLALAIPPTASKVLFVLLLVAVAAQLSIKALRQQRTRPQRFHRSARRSTS